MSHPVADQYEGTTIETTDVGFTFVGGRNGGSKHSSVLDVLREYGLVIDHHYNRVHNHILKSCLPLCKFFRRDHLALEMMSSISALGQHPVASQVLSTPGPTFKGTRERNAFI